MIDGTSGRPGTETETGPPSRRRRGRIIAENPE